MEDAIEEERILLKQRCDEYSARTQQAEQDAMYAMAECSRYMKEMEILRAKLDEEMANRKHLENHVSGFRTQVQEQAVRKNNSAGSGRDDNLERWRCPRPGGRRPTIATAHGGPGG